MKALRILEEDLLNSCSKRQEQYIKEAIKELEELENRSCWNCKYSEKTSGGVYCMSFSMHPDFEYCSDWKLKK